MIEVKSYTVKGHTFSVGDTLLYTRWGEIRKGIIEEIDYNGLYDSHFLCGEEKGLKWWVQDESIIFSEKQPVAYWVGKTVLYRETPVTIKREVYSTSEKPCVEGYDAEGRFYKFRLDSLRKLENPIEGVVEK